MARFVSIYRQGKFLSFLRRKDALRHIAKGRYRWRNEAAHEIEEVPLEERPHRRIFHDPPKNAHFIWKPRPSGATRIRILQAKWANQAK